MSTQPPYQPQQGSYQPPPIQPLSPQEERTWGMLCHLCALAGFIGIPLGSIIGPLVIWLIKKDASAFVNEQGRNSLNFQISCWCSTWWRSSSPRWPPATADRTSTRCRYVL